MIKYLFFTMFITLFALMNVYTYKRFLSKLSFFAGYKKALRFFFYIVSLFIILFLTPRYYDIFSQKVLIGFSYAIGVLFMLFVMAVIYDLLTVTFHNVPFDKQRRRFMKVAFDVTFLILTISYVLKGIVNGFKEPILRRVSVKLKDFKLEGFKIIQLSDVHVGNTIKKEFVQKLVERVNARKADLVVLTGDLVDMDVDKIKEDLAPLKALKSTYGTYFILGNHEYFHDAYKTIKYLKTLGIHVMLNESTVIAQGFNLVGMTDVIGDRLGVFEPDLPKAFSDINPGLPTIVLAHQPKMVKALESYKPDLIISGHTHGGQIFPFGLLVLLDQPYLQGLYQHDETTQIFVSRGAGYWGPAIRVFADSEIVELTLRGES
ncbi:MAG: metallophosphoesterase [Epsilonproteobacteria bacterium]|nr:metallophosphoesterase [Campylobacterota bacterium]